MNNAHICVAGVLAMTLMAAVASANEPQHVYDADGNLVEVLDEQQATAAYLTYDEDGNLVRTRDEDGELTDYMVDENAAPVD